MAVVTSSGIINTGYAVLALVADALVLLIVIAFVISRTSAVARERWGRLRDGITPFALQVAWIAAVLATFGSLYLQFGEQLNPCEFCWFQRICMYPLSLLLGIAAFRGDIQVAKRYFIGLAVVGAGLAVYHYQLERVPGEPTVCGSAVPCNVAVINVFGFISVPFLSMAAFLLITTLLLMARSRGDEYDDEEFDIVEGVVEIQPGDDAELTPA
ncbi:MAG TPA: disulfide bond formation protein B [Candidatus Dormibacteraeota bacterium]|jgi:disulfide bond formation protein DsbB|nr:disulfide bond formation protein B [Candidatus Dormibacteraeota bacterium]